MALRSIYFGSRELILTDDINTDLNDAFNAVYTYSSDKELNRFIERFLSTGDLDRVFVFGDDLDVLFDLIKKHFRYIEAAGGLVSNPKNEILFIFRRGKWDLPKGKSEKGETIEETALREVEEECGLTDLRLQEALPSTYHIYLEGKHTILKKTYWFKMAAPTQQGTPQTEEDIEHLEWLEEGEFDKVAKNTYPSVLTVLQAI